MMFHNGGTVFGFDVNQSTNGAHLHTSQDNVNMFVDFIFLYAIFFYPLDILELKIGEFEIR